MFPLRVFCTIGNIDDLTKIDIRWVLFEPPSTKIKNSPLLFANTAFHELRKIISSLLTRVDLQSMIHRMKMFFYFEILSSLFVLAMGKRADMAWTYLFKYIIIGEPGSFKESSSASCTQVFPPLLVQVLVNLHCCFNSPINDFNPFINQPLVRSKTSRGETRSLVVDRRRGMRHPNDHHR